MDENRFKATTIKILERRAANTCSNPYCRVVTSGPHTDQNKSVNIGVAAHIFGANPGSARYVAEMTPLERSSITNAVWLCSSCAKLIDSDDHKYTSKLLYEWKRSHESQVEKQISGIGWQRNVLEMHLAQFGSESPAAIQIALDKPEFWEYLLSVELLRSNFQKIRREHTDIARGLIYRKAKVLSEPEFFKWFDERLFDLMSMMSVTKLLVEEELISAWGELGVPGDPIEILYAVRKLVSVGNGLLDWELDVRFTRFPEELDSVKEQMQGWTEFCLREIENIYREIAKIFESGTAPEKGGHYHIRFEFKVPPNLNEVGEQVRRCKT